MTSESESLKAKSTTKAIHNGERLHSVLLFTHSCLSVRKKTVGFGLSCCALDFAFVIWAGH